MLVAFAVINSVTEELSVSEEMETALRAHYCWVTEYIQHVILYKIYHIVLTTTLASNLYQHLISSASLMCTRLVGVTTGQACPMLLKGLVLFPKSSN